jgi:hypothetical protein
MLTKRTKLPVYYEGDSEGEIVKVLEIFTLRTANGDELSAYVVSNRPGGVSHCDFRYCNKYKECTKLRTCWELKQFNRLFTKKVSNLKGILLL